MYHLYQYIAFLLSNFYDFEIQRILSFIWNLILDVVAIISITLEPLCME